MDKPLLRLLVTIVVVAFGTSFQIYNTCALNNIQLVVINWINSSFPERYGFSLTTQLADTFFGIVTAMPKTGAVIGAIFTQLISHKFGRRGGLILSSFVNLIGFLMVFLAKSANSYELLVIGRFILGFCMGFGIGIVGSFLTEITTAKHRGITGSIQHIFFGFGDVLALTAALPVVFGTAELWSLASIFPAFAALLQLVYLAVFAYETPHFLLIHKKTPSAAIKSIEFYQGENEVDKTVKLLESEQTCINNRDPNRPTIAQMFRKKHFRIPLLIASSLRIATAFGGVGVLMAYSANILTESGVDMNLAQYMTVIMGIVEMLFSLLSLAFIDRLGRRPLVFILLIGDMSALILLSCSNALHLFAGQQWAIYPPIVCVILFAAFMGFGGPVCWIITDEMFDSQTRSLAASIISPAYWAFQALSVVIYLPFKHAVGVTFSFFPFILALFLAIIFLYPRLPETKGRTVEHIIADFHIESLNGANVTSYGSAAETTVVPFEKLTTL